MISQGVIGITQGHQRALRLDLFQGFIDQPTHGRGITQLLASGIVKGIPARAQCCKMGVLPLIGAEVPVDPLAGQAEEQRVVADQGIDLGNEQAAVGRDGG